MSVTLHTSKGDLKIELFCDQVPRTCRNFLALAASDAYDGTKFHRVMRGFMAQGGDTSGTGKGGESIYGQFFDDEIVEDLRHDARGVVAMANKGPNTNGSQFFITFDKQSHLDNVNTVFGRVIYGSAVLDAIEEVATDKKHRPLEPIVIESVTIHANPLAELEA
jgi:peptidyl-prolyl cis-trans isomerase-like 3